MPTPTISRARPGGVQTAMAKKGKAGSTSSPSAKSAASTAPPNKSILSFFKKVPPPEESMFVANPVKAPPKPFFPVVQKKAEAKADDTKDSEDASEPGEVDETAARTCADTRFNECTASNKRRRLSETGTGPAEAKKTAPKPITRGPFVDDSDSDDDGDASGTSTDSVGADTRVKTDTLAIPREQLTSFDETFALPVATETRHEDAFGSDENDEFDEFEGEERENQRHMEYQAMLDAAEIAIKDESADRCPICDASFEGMTPDQATVHVNACLDGDAAADAATSVQATMPTTPSQSTAAAAQTTSPITSFSKRFVRTAQPRPGQANPIRLGSGLGAPATPQTPAAGSAFTKLMSGHAEDAAWATAAAAESASRGKPAYERTCPFYKIMPGVFRAICVDAFRYGAVQDCRAYFLSHFHSDHYIGLTAKWCHGPIYCSRVTGSLVRSQLGTAAKWVVELDFDKTADVPGTDGVRVTMIPANHCPGSALFLFERDMRGGRAQRILHCGDFRACRAHVDHPLLAPSVVDAVTHTTRQQRIDVCYLDTTYLSPKYSFPPQADVVSACASICASLDRSVRAGQQRDWDRVLRRRAGTASDSSGSVKDFFQTPAVPDAAADHPHDDEKAWAALAPAAATTRRRLLVVCGTYSIGKERICKAIAQALGSKIYATPAKIKIVAQLGDAELTALMTPHPAEAQVHMQMLMELRAETLADYLSGYRGHFSHIVGFRPSGWNYRPSMANADAGKTSTAAPASLSPSTLATTTLLHHAGWRTRFGVRDLVAQRGSSAAALCFGVPYSEHSSFRELALFLMTLRIDKVVPTVNVGSDVSRQRMKGWTDRWLAERRRGGLVEVADDDAGAGAGCGNDGNANDVKLWDGKDGLGGCVYW